MPVSALGGVAAHCLAHRRACPRDRFRTLYPHLLCGGCGVIAQKALRHALHDVLSVRGHEMGVTHGLPDILMPQHVGNFSQGLTSPCTTRTCARDRGSENPRVLPVPERYGSSPRNRGEILL